MSHKWRIVGDWMGLIHLEQRACVYCGARQSKTRLEIGTMFTGFVWRPILGDCPGDDGEEEQIVNYPPSPMGIYDISQGRLGHRKDKK
jgi:hypothetical protein